MKTLSRLAQEGYEASFKGDNFEYQRLLIDTNPCYFREPPSGFIQHRPNGSGDRTLPPKR
jgi:hypothetical protein